MADWKDGYWWSNDGLRLHYRDYLAKTPSRRPPIICIPGLTRNARDFESVAERLCTDWRVIVVELRGRGESAYARDPLTYAPLVYLQDLEALIQDLAIDRMVLFGTSLGGLLTMLLASAQRERIAAALINDIGPSIEESGLDRIRSHVGRSQTWPTWMHAARHFAEMQKDVYPRWNLEQWLAQAKRLCRLNQNGRIVLDYDMKIAEPFRLPGGEAGFDLWKAFQCLDGIPLLVVKGERSDLLSDDTLSKMKARVPGMESVVIGNVGHTPTLTEVEAEAAIDRLLDKVRPL